MGLIYQTTPTVQDQYSRNFIQLFDEANIVGVARLFQAFFSKNNSTTLYSPDSNVFDVDIMRAKETIAALVPRGTISQKLGSTQKDTTSQQYSTFSRSFPLIEEEGSVNAGQLLNRVAGEGPGARKTRLERMRVLVGREHKEQIRRTIRLCEYLASQSILYGTMPAILGTVNDELIYNWRRNTDHQVTLAESWWVADHDIMADLYAGWVLGRENAHVSYDALLLGNLAMSAFIQSSQVQTLADNRRFQLIEVGSTPVPAKYNWMLEAGAIARGRLQLPEGPELWLFTYLDGYTDGSGDLVNYMPPPKVLMFWSEAETTRFFGPPERLPNDSQEQAWYREMFGFNMLAPPMPPNIKASPKTIASSMFYFDAMKSVDKKKVVPRLQAAPVFAPIQTDAYVTFLNAGTVPT
jgi:hypothetical protein